MFKTSIVVVAIIESSIIIAMQFNPLPQFFYFTIWFIMIIAIIHDLYFFLEYRKQRENQALFAKSLLRTLTLGPQAIQDIGAIQNNHLAYISKAMRIVLYALVFPDELSDELFDTLPDDEELLQELLSSVP